MLKDKLGDRYEFSNAGDFDNKYMESPDNKAGLITTLKGLYNMKKSIITSNSKIEDMVSSFMFIKGAERKLTQSANSLEEQMRTYLDIMNAASSSIDRIISKSEL